MHGYWVVVELKSIESLDTVLPSPQMSCDHLTHWHNTWDHTVPHG